MPQFYKRKDGAKQRKVIPPNIMASATKFDIDRMTLTTYIAKYRLNPRDTHNLQSNYKIRQIFSDEEETMLKDYIIKSSKLNYILSRKGVCKLAYDFAVANNNNVPHSWDTNCLVGNDWFRGSMKRHTTLSL